MAKQLNQDTLQRIELSNHKVPSQKTIKGKPYIQFGDDNLYPQYLIELASRSATHNALLSGKSTYVFGQGFKIKDESKVAEFNRFFNYANSYENLNCVVDKCIKDLLLHGGYALQVIWGKASQKISQLAYINIANIRQSEDENILHYCENWDKPRPTQDKTYKTFNVFNKNKKSGTAILIFKEYRSGLKEYQLPEYLGGISAIESAIEVANWHLNNIKNGFSSGTIINFSNGIPTEEKQKEISKKVKGKTTGTDKAGEILVNFSDGKDRGVEISNSNPNDLDKQFLELNKHIQQDIFVSHKIVSPVLFGVATEGALGQRNEMLDAYEIFTNTYVKPKQQLLEKQFNELAVLAGLSAELEIIPLEPIKFQLTESTLVEILTKDELRVMAGYEPTDTIVSTNANRVIDAINSLSPLVANKVLESMSANEIRSLVGLGQTTEVVTPTQVAMSSVLNFLDKEILLLISKNSLITDAELVDITGLSINKVKDVIKNLEGLLLINTANSTGAKSAIVKQITDAGKQIIDGLDDAKVSLFSEFGFSEEDYEIVSSTSQFTFAELSDIDKRVLQLINDNPKVLVMDIATALDKPVKDVVKSIQGLIDNKYIEQVASKNNGVTEIERTTTAKGKEIASTEKPKTELLTMYKYDWADHITDRNPNKMRPLCDKLMGLKNRLYTRENIDTISDRLGYNVFSMRGGYYHNPKTNITTPYCRHQWYAVTVKKK